MSVGYDHIDLEECKKRNIAVGNTPVISTESVADFALTLLLSAARRIPEGLCIFYIKIRGVKDVP